MFEMGGDKPREFVDAFAALFDEPVRDLRVVNAAQFSKQAFVGDVSKQFVFEEVLDRAGKCRGFLAKDQFLAAQTGQSFAQSALGRIRRSGFCRGPESFHGAVPENPSDDGGALEHEPFGRLQTVQPRLQNAGQRGRHARGGEAIGFAGCQPRPGGGGGTELGGLRRRDRGVAGAGAGAGAAPSSAAVTVTMGRGKG